MLHVCVDLNWMQGRTLQELDRLFLSEPALLQGRSFLAENLMAYFFRAPDKFWKGEPAQLIDRIVGQKLGGYEIEKYLLAANTERREFLFLVPFVPGSLQELYAASLAPGAVILLAPQAGQSTVDVDVAFARHQVASLGVLEAEGRKWLGYTAITEEPVTTAWVTRMRVPTTAIGKEVRYYWLLGGGAEHPFDNSTVLHIVLAHVDEISSSAQLLADALRGIFSTARRDETVGPQPLHGLEPASWLVAEESWKSKVPELKHALKATTPDPARELGSGYQVQPLADRAQREEPPGAGEVDQLIAALRTQVRQKPRDVDIRMLLANLLMARGQPKEALEHAHEAVRLAPRRAEARATLGFLLATQGDYAAGEKELREAASLDPKSANIGHRLGWVYNHMKEPDLAILELRRALQLDPKHPFAWFDLGVSYTLKGDNQNAIESYNKAIKVDPSNPDPYINLAGTYAQMKREKDAAEVYERALSLDSGRADARLWNNAAWLLCTAADPKVRNPSKAIQYALKAVALTGGKDSGFLDTLAEAYFASGDYGKAIECEEKAIQLAPNDTQLKQQLEKFRKAKDGKQ